MQFSASQFMLVAMTTLSVASASSFFDYEDTSSLFIRSLLDDDYDFRSEIHARSLLRREAEEWTDLISFVARQGEEAAAAGEAAPAKAKKPKCVCTGFGCATVVNGKKVMVKKC